MPEHTTVAKTVKDPNCGMPVDAARAVASGNTLADRGATYYFCSKQCKQEFQSKQALRSDPTGAAAAHGGGFDD